MNKPYNVIISLKIEVWYKLVLISTNLLYQPENQISRVYLNSDEMSATMGFPQIPSTTSPTTAYLCGTEDTTTARSYIDISRLDILSSVGFGYQESEGTNLYHH